MQNCGEHAKTLHKLCTMYIRELLELSSRDNNILISVIHLEHDADACSAEENAQNKVIHKMFANDFVFNYSK